MAEPSSSIPDLLEKPSRRSLSQKLRPLSPFLHPIALLPLPTRPYDAVLTVERRISQEGMVAVGGNQYSVPDTTRRRVVEVQNHPAEVRIFEDGHLVASHPVLEGKNQRRVDPSHRKPVPPARRAVQLTAPPADVPVARRPLAFYEAVGRRLANAPEGRP